MPVQGGYLRRFDSPGGDGLREPLALVAFGGWVDAGSAGTGAVRYLVESLSATKYADVDPEEFYSFTDTRPLTTNVGPGERATHWPRGEFYFARLPEPATRDLVLFVAPEPNLKWRTFCTLVLDTLDELGVRTLVTVGSVFGAVHHRGDVPITGWATDARLREALQRRQVSFTNYEGPTGIMTVLLAEAQSRGIPSMALVGFTPNYVQGVPNPRTSHAILRAAADLTGTPLGLDGLERAGRVLARQIDRLLADQPELRERVERMLSLVNVTEPAPLPDEPEVLAEDELRAGDKPVELPSPEAFVKEMEEYLKQLRGEDPKRSDSGGDI